MKSHTVLSSTVQRTRRAVAVAALLVVPAIGCTSPVSAQASGAATTPTASYDPLHVSANATRPTADFDVVDAARQRTIPIRVYRPRSDGPAPVLLFSHGLGGARTNNPYLGEHWSARGYVVVFLQHAGSDESVWKNVGPLRRMRALRGAANAQNFLLRTGDVPAVLDALTRWNADPTHPLAGALDLAHIGMSGHSFGAVTTQAVSGQTFPDGRAAYRDARIDAAVIMSPSTPAKGTAAQAFGTVSMPWLLMTGTKDVARVGGQTLENRLEVYPALPAGSKYELVLFDAEHSAFGDRALPGESDARNPNHHRAILALTTAFWDAYVRDDPAARAWLDGPEAGRVLETKDRWMRK